MPLLLLCRFAQTSAAVVLAGTLGLRLLARGTGAGARWNALAWGSWAVLLAAGAGQLVCTAADMGDVSLAQACSREALGGVLGGTRFGAVWIAREGLLAGLLAAGAAGAALAWDLAGALLVAGLLASLVWTGHAQASERGVWLLPLIVLHALAAGVWPGGLLPLTLWLARARRDPGLTSAALIVTRRFSQASVVAVAILAGSGSWNAYGLVGSVPALWLSTYGRLLLCKVALFAAMVVLGAVNRRALATETSRGPAETLRCLRRNLGWECALAAGVLLATEALASSAPPN